MQCLSIHPSNKWNLLLKSENSFSMRTTVIVSLVRTLGPNPIDWCLCADVRAKLINTSLILFIEFFCPKSSLNSLFPAPLVPLLLHILFQNSHSPHSFYLHITSNSNKHSHTRYFCLYIRRSPSSC